MGKELQILDCLQGLHGPVQDTIMAFITGLGDKGIVWILLAAVLLCMPKKRKTGWTVVLALCVDLILCNLLLKNMVARVRPFDVNTAVSVLIARPKDFSFPSGHTAASFASVAALYLAGERKLWKPALLLAVLIAFSRMYFYVHYPTDILGGILTGIVSGIVANKMVQKYLKKGKEKG